MDRRAHHCMAQPMSKARQRLGEPQSQGARLLAPRLNPPHAAKTLQSNMMFPDRLLGRMRSSFFYAGLAFSTPERCDLLQDVIEFDPAFSENAVQHATV